MKRRIRGGRGRCPPRRRPAINLELEGYEPLLAASAEDGLTAWKRGGVDLILLDVMLPGMDGFAFCAHVRHAGDRVPILFLTARGAGQDRIRGLDEGGDDYITKPFDLQELLARIKSIFRRQDRLRGQGACHLTIGRAAVNLRTYEVPLPVARSSSKEKEAMILRLLCSSNRAKPVDRQTILDRVWGFDAYPHHAHGRQLHPSRCARSSRRTRPSPPHRDGSRRRVSAGL
ncbi:MAG: response regulator transcription factor [bacterium]|nr:response regulator transcription factor [bacterium]